MEDYCLHRASQTGPQRLWALVCSWMHSQVRAVDRATLLLSWDQHGMAWRAAPSPSNRSDRGQSDRGQTKSTPMSEAHDIAERPVLMGYVSSGRCEKIEKQTWSKFGL